MTATPKQYAKALLALTKDADSEKEAKEIVKKFVRILVSDNKSAQVEKIVSYFVKLWDEEKGVVEAEIINARKIEKNVVSILNDYINKKTKGQKVVSKQTVDKNILGGVIIKYDDKILDGSLRTKLRDFRKKISE